MNFSSLALEVDALAQMNSVGYQLTGKATRARVRASAAKYVDLFLGYVMRAEMTHGWWERERRIRTPNADGWSGGYDSPVKGERKWLKWIHQADRREGAETWTVRTAISMWQAADITLVERSRAWLSGGVVDIRTLRLHTLARYSTAHARNRLEEETGYRQLWTPEECLDASRIYPRRSVAARFCLALADLCPTPERRRVA